MKLAQEVRAGNVIMIGPNPMVVQKAEIHEIRPQRVGREDEAQKPAFGPGDGNHLSRRREVRRRSSSRRRRSRYSYFADPMYVFMDDGVQPGTMSKRRQHRGCACPISEDGLALRTDVL